MTRDYSTPKPVHTPVRIEVHKLDLHGQEKLDLQVGGHSRLILEPNQAVEIALKILLESGQDHAHAKIIDTARGRRLDIKWRPNSFELRHLVEKIEGR